MIFKKADFHYHQSCWKEAASYPGVILIDREFDLLSY